MASPLSTFHLFPNLPAELQARIWKEAAYDEKRMVKLSIRGDALLVTDAPVPKLFLVNKDVYNILKIFYTRFLNGQLFPTYSPAQQGPLFSFEYDIFLIDWDYWDIALIIHDGMWWFSPQFL
ncbi:hypothetical protein F4820DRAFT_419331 [Hypoxylon rubiginosum]|uniref:Uncharacterized protein n=1 Tax=Hypoxylon rubiginosum TaxID=110542 RepID=A0ACB9Z2K5_9PEZI|nr:hypothetical protein F4820DRAFT_419331 [Hypoxylon rubiginosum]